MKGFLIVCFILICTIGMFMAYYKPTAVEAQTGYQYGDRLSRVEQARIMQECIDDAASLWLWNHRGLSQKWRRGTKVEDKLSRVALTETAKLFFHYRTGMMMPMQQR